MAPLNCLDNVAIPSNQQCSRVYGDSGGRQHHLTRGDAISGGGRIFMPAQGSGSRQQRCRSGAVQACRDDHGKHACAVAQGARAVIPAAG